MIYRDFDHYWKKGNHGWSSVSYDLAKEEWDRFEHTINASRDEYKEMYITLCKEIQNNKSELTENLFQYLEIYKKDDAPKFFKWWSDKINKEHQND